MVGWRQPPTQHLEGQWVALSEAQLDPAYQGRTRPFGTYDLKGQQALVIRNVTGVHFDDQVGKAAHESGVDVAHIEQAQQYGLGILDPQKERGSAAEDVSKGGRRRLAVWGMGIPKSGDPIEHCY